LTHSTNDSCCKTWILPPGAVQNAQREITGASRFMVLSMSQYGKIMSSWKTIPCHYLSWLSCVLLSISSMEFESMMRHRINTKAASLFWMCCLLWLPLTLLPFQFLKCCIPLIYLNKYLWQTLAVVNGLMCFGQQKHWFIRNDTNFRMNVGIFQVPSKILSKSILCIYYSTLFQCHNLNILLQLN
jgi:hypothetical protein